MTTVAQLLENWRTADDFDQHLELVIADAAEEAGYPGATKLRRAIHDAYPAGVYDPTLSLVRVEMEKLRRWNRAESGAPAPTWPR